MLMTEYFSINMKKSSLSQTVQKFLPAALVNVQSFIFRHFRNNAKLYILKYCMGCTYIFETWIIICNKITTDSV